MKIYPGINRDPLPSTSESDWRLNIQEHAADRSGLHYDLRLSPMGSASAYSWAVKHGLPSPGNKTLAVLQPTHDASYMGWSGKISMGYGKGNVRSIIDESVKVLNSNNDEISFVMTSSHRPNRYLLKRLSGDDWLLYNYTSDKDIPISKPHYKEISLSSVSSDNKNEVLAPKIDGAHNVIMIRPNKRIDVYSYRRSKKDGEVIDHTYKTDLYKIRGPKELGETVIRGELFIPGQSNNIITGVLNSNTNRAVTMQKQIGKFNTMIFDIDKYKGKDVSKYPYYKKLSLLKEVNEAIPELLLPTFSYTQQEKLKLLDQIKSGTHPETKEGVIVYNLQEPVPVKAKRKHDYDALIIGVYPASVGSKYYNNAIGGFLARPYNSKTTIRVGSGLSDELRRAAYNNPGKFIGQWAKLIGQEEFESGKLRSPIFKSFRAEKY